MATGHMIFSVLDALCARLDATISPAVKSYCSGSLRAPSAGLHPLMRRSLLLFATVLIALAVAPGHARPFFSRGTPQVHNDTSPTDAERKDLFARTIANQHINDDALQLFERIEHRVVHDHDISSGAGEDRTARLIPTGAGSARITLAEHGRPADPAAIQAQLALTERQLEAAVDPSNTQTQRDREKIERRNRERKELVGYVHEAFIFTWMGREVRDGRTLVKFRLDSNPNFKPPTFKAEFLRHATATAWVDEKSAELVRLEAVLTTDVSVMAGIVGKVYRNGHALLEQSEVEPGIWLPTLTQYDFTYRKFLFTSEVHERMEATHYRRVGPPAQALTAIRNEISATNHGQP